MINMAHAFYVPTDTHSEYLIFIALPRQQWLRERATIISYMFIVSLNNL